jgi:hypothetical protein
LEGYISPFPFTGSALITGSLGITGSLNVTQGITGSFSGSGANLFDIPASGIVGLNLSQIISGSVSASISPNDGLQVNTNVTAPSFTGSLFGTASFAISSSNALTASYAQTGGDLTLRYTTTFIATEGQTNFTVVQELLTGYFDVYLNGVKVNDTSYSATDLTITFDDPCIVGDIVDIVSYNALRLTSRDTRRNAIDSTNSNTNYCGVAPNGSLESASVWAITKIVVANDGNVTTTSATDVAWTDRETAIYT